MKSLVIFLVTIQLVNAAVVASKNIYYNQQINTNNAMVTKVDEKLKCKLLTLKYLESKKLLAVHYIKKNSPICIKDTKAMDENRVIYKFGAFLEAEEYGKVIVETNRYIKIKKSNGKIKKLFKDGEFR